MTQNTMIFNNQTEPPLPAQYILYLGDGSSAYLQRIVWYQMIAPQVPAGLTWSDEWSVAFGSVENGIYTATELQASAVGRRWMIRNFDGALKLEEVGAAPEGYIEIGNDSGKLMNPGVGVAGAPAVYVPNVLSNSYASFKISSLRYWLAVPTLPVQTGELLDPSAFLLPAESLTDPVAVTATLTGGPPYALQISETFTKRA